MTSQDLADTLRMATYGDYSSALPKLNLPQRQIPIRVRLDPTVRGDASLLGQLRVPGTDGAVTLAEIGFGSGPAQLDRMDGNGDSIFPGPIRGAYPPSYPSSDAG